MELTVLFTVVAACIGILLDKVDSASQANIENFLQALQQQLAQEQRQQRQQQRNQQLHYKDEAESSYGSLKKRDLDKIFSLSSQLEKKQRKNKRKQRRQQQDEEYYLLRQPYSQGQNLVANELIGLEGNRDSASSSESNNREDDGNQNDYSKVYVILNSEAIRKSKNKEKLNALLSSLLDAPPQQKHNRNQNQADQYQDKQDWYQLSSNWNQDEEDRYQNQQNRGRKKERRYKGFAFNNNNFEEIALRRKMSRGSGESMESRPMPKPSRQREQRERPRRGRERGNGGGGGGNNGGHTAIPYIRQHGDIYERDD